VTVINDAGVSIELIQTALDGGELWDRARRSQGSLYRSDV